MTAEDQLPPALTGEDVCRVVGRRVRERRADLGLTMEQLADRAGMSIGMLSKIENGQTSPSFGTLTALSHAARVPFTAFFRGLDEEHDAVLVRRGEGQRIEQDGGPGRTYEDLGTLRGPLREIEPVLITITEPDEVFPLFQHAGVEFLHILEGIMEYGYGSNRYVLQPGDTIQFRGDVAHGPTELVELPIRFLSLKVYAHRDD